MDGCPPTSSLSPSTRAGSSEYAIVSRGATLPTAIVAELVQDGGVPAPPLHDQLEPPACQAPTTEAGSRFVSRTDFAGPEPTLSTLTVSTACCPARTVTVPPTVTSAVATGAPAAIRTL